MKEDKKVRGALFSYMQWPILVIGFGDLREYCGSACVQTGGNCNVRFYRDLPYLRRGRRFSSAENGRWRNWWRLLRFYNENQKQLLASMELPYGIADTDGRLLWVNRAMEAILKE